MPAGRSFSTFSLPVLDALDARKQRISFHRVEPLHEQLSEVIGVPQETRT